MDQRFVAGIGNIYSDEALFEARLRFDRPAGSLSGEEVGRLHRAVRKTLRDAVTHRGSSLRDAQYVDLFGAPGGLPEPPPGLRPGRGALPPLRRARPADLARRPFDVPVRDVPAVTAPEPIRRRVLIKGRVQGVGFRWSCRRMAESQGVAGWCRNLPDGRVEACFEGDPAAVERAVAWCRERAAVGHRDLRRRHARDAHGGTGIRLG